MFSETARKPTQLVFFPLTHFFFCWLTQGYVLFAGCFMLFSLLLVYDSATSRQCTSTTFPWKLFWGGSQPPPLIAVCSLMVLARLYLQVCVPQECPYLEGCPSYESLPALSCQHHESTSVTMKCPVPPHPSPSREGKGCTPYSPGRMLAQSKLKV